MYISKFHVDCIRSDGTLCRFHQNGFMWVASSRDFGSRYF